MNNIVNEIDKNASHYLLNELNKKIDKLSNFKQSEIEYLESRDNYDEDDTTANMHKFNQNENDLNLKKIHNLQTLSFCQLCKCSFNISKNLPLLFKCGHFFCKSCILKISKENNNKIICPEDGYTEKYLQDLKVLKNLINDEQAFNLSSNSKKDISVNNNSNYQSNSNKISTLYCPIHLNEKLCYYCYNTEELLCVYCAFDLYRKNNQLRIVEMNEKCNDIILSVNEVLENNEDFIRSLRQSLSEMKKNKVEEENRINNYFKDLHAIIEEKRNNLINYIGVIFSQNSVKIEEKFDFFIKKMQDAEIIKHNIELYMKNQLTDVYKIINCYNNFLKENKSDQLEILQVKFTSKKLEFDDIFRNLFDLKLNTKYISTVAKPKYSNTDDFLTKSSFITHGRNTFLEGNRTLKHNKSSSHLDTKNIKQYKETNVLDNKFMTPMINNDAPKSIRLTGKDVIDTVELLEENDNQYEKIQQQFNLKK